MKFPTDVGKILSDSGAFRIIYHGNSQSDSDLAFMMTPFVKGFGYVLIHVYIRM